MGADGDVAGDDAGDDGARRDGGGGVDAGHAFHARRNVRSPVDKGVLSWWGCRWSPLTWTTMSHSTSSPRHPLLACADTIEKALASVVDCDPVYLDAGDRADLMVRLPTLISQVQALNLKLVAASGDVAADDGCRTVADWVAPRTRTDRRAAYAQERLARALDTTWRHVGAALSEGRVHLDQARVVVKALEALPDEVTSEVRQLAEQRLVEHAEDFGPTELARLGRRILDVIAPEVGDEQERQALERAERKAECVTRLDLRRRGDGSTDISATVPDAVAARLTTYLEAFTSPRQGDGVDPATGGRVPADRQRGQAFCALLERLDPAMLPDHGGLATTLMVTMPLETLESGLGTAQLGTGEAISAGEARRLACTAGLDPCRPRHQERAARPGPHRPVVHAGPAQGARGPEPAMPSGGLRGPGALDRGPSRHPLESSRPDRRERRHPPLPLAPPQSPRPLLPKRAHAQRRRALPPAKVMGVRRSEPCAHPW